MRPRARRFALPIAVCLIVGSLSAMPAAADRDGTPRVRRATTKASSADPSPRIGDLLTTRPRGSVDGSAAGRSAAARGVRAPSVVSGFDALTAGDAGVLASPADPTGAAGPDFFMAAVNVAVSVYDRSGTEVAGPERLATLFPGLPANDTDPKVLYDTYDDVFLLVYLVYNNTKAQLVIVFVPGSTADDLNTWCGLVINGDQVAGDGKQFADYPTVGFTADRVAIASNNFDFDSGIGPFDYVQVLSFAKSQLYDPTCSIIPVPKVFKGLRDPDGSRAFTLQPAETIGGTEPKTQYLTEFDWNGPSIKSSLVLWRLKRQDGKLRITKTAIGVGKVSLPPLGRQCDGSFVTDTKWDTGDSRLINAYFDVDAGMLYTAHTVGRQFGAGATESATRWYEVDPGSPLDTSTVARKGLIGADGDYTGWPSVATDAEGVLFVNHSRASEAADECLSIDVATVPVASTVASAPLEVVAGGERYDFGSGSERWGDYSAINRDPADPTGATMAIFNAYAPSDGGGATTDTFQQFVALVTDA
jgi:hypothetical protein